MDLKINKTSVLIVGAGPTGLALACALREKDVDVNIVEKMQTPSQTSRAFGLHVRGREILERLGAMKDLAERALKPVGFNVHVKQQLMVHAVLQEQTGPLLIAQSEIEGHLRSRLQELGTQVLWDHELICAEQDENGVDVTVRVSGTDQKWRVDWLIGCEGAHSVVRKLAKIPFKGAAFPQVFLLADVGMDWKRPVNEFALWLDPRGIFGAIPLPGNIWRILAELDPNDATISENDAIHKIQRLLREIAGDTTTRIFDPTWISLFRTHRRLVSSYRNGRMLIAGDAAHIHSPIGGQGMNTGLGDAFNLGWKLALVAKKSASDRLLDTYQVERRPVATNVVYATSLAWKLILGKNAMLRFIRNKLFFPLLRLNKIQRILFLRASGILTQYRNGPLGLAWWKRLFISGPKPGDRCPDLPCRLHSNGNSTTLGEQAGTHWALVLFGGPNQDQLDCIQCARARLSDVIVVLIGEKPAKHIDVNIIDDQLMIAKSFRPAVTESMFLRPDGHIAWRSKHSKTVELKKWIENLLK